MKTGTIISKQELENDGWKYIHSFGHSYIYGKGTERVLWNPVSHKIELWYNEKNPML